MRNDVLVDELRTRLGASQEALLWWFNSLTTDDRLRAFDIMNAQIEDLRDQAGQEIVRKNQLESIKRLFSDWATPDPA